MRMSWIPREHKFFDMFDETTAIVVKAAEAFTALVEHYDRQGLVRRVDGTQDIAAVTAAVVSAVGSEAAGAGR